MAKFVVDLWLDGYETQEEMEKACEVFIYQQLNFTGSSVKVSMFDNDEKIKGDEK
jgi:hypothetical protein